MHRLSDAQLVLLSAAAQRDDRAFDACTTDAEPATTRVIAQLIKRDLLEETAAKRGMPVWRKDEDAGAVALVITEAGLHAIGVAPAEFGKAERDSPARSRSDAADGGRRQKRSAEKRTGTVSTAIPESPRAGTKLSNVIALLGRQGGASLADLTDATGWLPHTARAALTGLRKRGYSVTKGRGAHGNTCYRLDRPGHAEDAGPVT